MAADFASGPVTDVSVLCVLCTVAAAQSTKSRGAGKAAYITALQTVRKAMTHIYYGVENEGLRLSLWAARAGSSFSTPKSAVASFPHCL